MRRESDIVIIGAGIMGSSLAYFLSKKGKQVTVLEQGEICSGTSSSTAAWLWPSDKKPSIMHGWQKIPMTFTWVWRRNWAQVSS